MSGVLGNVKTVGAGVSNVYEVPSGKVFEGNVSVHSATQTTSIVKLTASPSASPTNIHTIQLDTLNPIKKGYERRALVLSAGEFLSVNTDSADTTVVVYGIERDSSNLEVNTKTLISTNSETNVFEVTDPSTVASCSISVCLAGNTTLDKAKVKLYVTTSNVLSGYLIQEEELDFTNITGFSKSGIMLNSGYKLFIKTESQVGDIAVRVHGFKRLEN